jgi:hypothetical protein
VKFTEFPRVHTIINSTIYLHWLQQREVYHGLLEGHPTREVNEGLLRGLMGEARERTNAALFVVPPREERIGGDDYPFDDAVVMPSIACIGHFESLSPVHERRRTTRS